MGGDETRRPERMTPAQWAEWLTSPATATAREFTLEEFVAGCLSILVGDTKAVRDSVRHSEACDGARDEFFRNLAIRFQVKYPEGGVVREALDLKWKLMQRMTEEQQRNFFVWLDEQPSLPGNQLTEGGESKPGLPPAPEEAKRGIPAM